MTIPEKIRHYRTELNLTAVQLADLMNRPGLSSCICRWEKGERVPAEKYLVLLRKAFLRAMENQKKHLKKIEETFDL